MTDLRSAIVDAYVSVFRDMVGSEPDTPADDLVLLKSGLDSLGFAALVAQLEDDLGFDPFTLAENPYYPTTFGDFVAFYARQQPTS